MCRNAPFSVRNSNSLLTSVFPLLTNRESVRLTSSSVSATITCAMDSLLSEYEPSEYRDALANLCVYVGERDR
mgnify:CR=1 FL=1